MFIRGAVRAVLKLDPVQHVLSNIDRLGHRSLCSGLKSHGGGMNVHLTPELEQLVQGRVKSGRYNSASEVVGEALRLLEQRDEVFALRKDEIRKQIEEGWHAAKRGDVIDGEEVFDRIDKELEVMERSTRK
jgi:antitoxin ParD1/3/4